MGEPALSLGSWWVKPAANDDVASGALVYMRARYYDPGIGRFISEDPAGLDAGVNLSAYVAGNPISRSDPSGLHFGLAIIGTPVENSFPYRPDPALAGAVSNGVGGLLGGAVLCGLPCAAGGAVAGAFTGVIFGGQDIAPAAAGFVPLLSQSAVSGSVPPSAILGAGIEGGILAFGPDGDPTAKNIFASTVAGGVLGPSGAAAGLIGSSTSSILSSLITRGSCGNP